METLFRIISEIVEFAKIGGIILVIIISRKQKLAQLCRDISNRKYFADLSAYHSTFYLTFYFVSPNLICLKVFSLTTFLFTATSSRDTKSIVCYSGTYINNKSRLSSPSEMELVIIFVYQPDLF